MKLPTYESPALERHIPQQNVGAEGRAMAQFGQAAGQAFDQVYEQESVTEYNKAIADFKNFQSELVASYDQNAYMDADALGSLATKENIDEFAVKDDDGNPTGEVQQGVRTDKVMSEHYKQETEKVYKAMLSGFRTAKGRNSFREAYEYKIRPQGQAAIDASALETNRSMNRAEFLTNDLPKLIKAGDAEATEEAIELSVASGILSLEEGVKYTASAVNEIATNEYAAFASDPDTTAEELEARKAEIPDDGDLLAEQRLKVDQAYQKAIYAAHDDDVSGAIIHRDARQLAAMKEEYGPGYKGSMTEGQRLNLLNRIETAIKDLTAGNELQDYIALQESRIEADRVMQAVANGTSRPEELAGLQSSPMFDFGGANEKPTQKDVRLRQELGWTLDIANDLVGFHRMTPGDRDAFINQYAGDGAENEFKRDYMTRYSENIREQVTENQSDYVITSGLGDTMTGYTQPATPDKNPDFLQVLDLRAKYNAELAKREGVATGPLTKNEIVDMQNIWGASGIPGRIELMQSFNSLGPGQAQAIMQQLGPGGLGNAGYVAGVISSDPTIDGTKHEAPVNDVATKILIGVGQLADDDQRIKYFGNRQEEDVLRDSVATKIQELFPTRADAIAAADAYLAYVAGSKAAKGDYTRFMSMSENDVEKIFGDVVNVTVWYGGSNRVLTPGHGVSGSKFKKWLRSESIDTYIDDSMLAQLGRDPEFTRAKSEGRIFSGAELREGIEDGSFKLLPTHTRGVYFVRVVGGDGVVGLNGNKFRLIWDENYGD